MSTRRLRICATGLLLAAALGCGKKGPPQPPLRPVPARVADLSASRIDDRIELRFTIPAANTDGTTPAAIDRVEVYAAPVMAGATSLTADDVASDPKRLRTRVPVRPPTLDAPPPNAKPDTRPAAGDAATFVDRVDAAFASATAIQYVVAAVTPGRGRSGAMAMVVVPLADPPPAPQKAAIAYDETTLTLSWTPAAQGQSFRVYSTNTATPAPLGAPLTAASFTQPVQFGREVCFAVRAMAVIDRVTVEGPLTSPVCETPRDTFGPPAPSGLEAVQDGTAVTLVWRGVEAPDLAGYLVLRGDGASGTLRRLNTDPIALTTFRDGQVQAGASYTYSVVAIDKSGNLGEQSNRQPITVR